MRVVDARVLPLRLGGNLMATVNAITEKVSTILGAEEANVEALTGVIGSRYCQ